MTFKNNTLTCYRGTNDASTLAVGEHLSVVHEVVAGQKINVLPIEEIRGKFRTADKTICLLLGSESTETEVQSAIGKAKTQNISKEKTINDQAPTILLYTDEPLSEECKKTLQMHNEIITIISSNIIGAHFLAHKYLKSTCAQILAKAHVKHRPALIRLFRQALKEMQNISEDTEDTIGLEEKLKDTVMYTHGEYIEFVKFYIVAPTTILDVRSFSDTYAKTLWPRLQKLDPKNRYSPEMLRGEMELLDDKERGQKCLKDNVLQIIQRVEEVLYWHDVQLAEYIDLLESLHQLISREIPSGKDPLQKRFERFLRTVRHINSCGELYASMPHPTSEFISKRRVLSMSDLVSSLQEKDPKAFQVFAAKMRTADKDNIKFTLTEYQVQLIQGLFQFTSEFLGMNMREVTIREVDENKVEVRCYHHELHQKERVGDIFISNLNTYYEKEFADNLSTSIHVEREKSDIRTEKEGAYYLSLKLEKKKAKRRLRIPFIK